MESPCRRRRAGLVRPTTARELQGRAQRRMGCECRCVYSRAFRRPVCPALFDSFFVFVLAHPILVGLWVALLVGFIFNEGLRGGKSLSPQQVVDLMNRQNAVVVDLRERKDFSAGHIVGALNIPSAALLSRLIELEPHRARPIVMACAMGQQAGAAGASLRKAGFANVVRLAGGISEWRNSNLPLVKG